MNLGNQVDNLEFSGTRKLHSIQGSVQNISELKLDIVAGPSLFLSY